MSKRPPTTKSKITRFLCWSAFIVILIPSILAIHGFRYAESAEKIQSSWQIQAMAIDGQKREHEFEGEVLFLTDNRVLLPRHIHFDAGTPIKYGNWKYKRTNYFNGRIEILDEVQHVFSGVYEIQAISHSNPQLVKIYSDKIEIYLRRDD